MTLASLLAIIVIAFIVVFIVIIMTVGLDFIWMWDNKEPGTGSDPPKSELKTAVEPIEPSPSESVKEKVKKVVKKTKEVVKEVAKKVVEKATPKIEKLFVVPVPKKHEIKPFSPPAQEVVKAWKPVVAKEVQWNLSSWVIREYNGEVQIWVMSGNKHIPYMTIPQFGNLETHSFPDSKKVAGAKKQFVDDVIDITEKKFVGDASYENGTLKETNRNYLHALKPSTKSKWSIGLNQYGGLAFTHEDNPTKSAVLGMNLTSKTQNSLWWMKAPEGGGQSNAYILWRKHSDKGLPEPARIPATNASIGVSEALKEDVDGNLVINGRFVVFKNGGTGVITPLTNQKVAAPTLREGGLGGNLQNLYSERSEDMAAAAASKRAVDEAYQLVEKIEKYLKVAAEGKAAETKVVLQKAKAALEKMQALERKRVQIIPLMRAARKYELQRDYLQLSGVTGPKLDWGKERAEAAMNKAQSAIDAYKSL